MYASSTTTYSDLLAAVQTFADGFLAINAKYTPSGGGLAEQYSRSNGAPLSAVDLTWSYAATVTAFGARAGVVPASWGASGLTVPSSCSTNSGGGGGVGTVSITFNEFATTVFGGERYTFLLKPSLTRMSFLREHLLDRVDRCSAELVSGHRAFVEH